MKKMFALVLAAALAVSVLAGCSKKENEGGEAAKGVNLTEFYGTIQEMMNEKYGEENAPVLEVMEDEMLDAFYPGLSELELKQCVVAGPVITAVVSEFALAEAQNAEDAAKVAEIFQTRIDTQAEGGAWYPETVEGWQNNATVVTNGSFVFMVAMEDNEVYIAAFNELFQ